MRKNRQLNWILAALCVLAAAAVVTLVFAARAGAPSAMPQTAEPVNVILPEDTAATAVPESTPQLTPEPEPRLKYIFLFIGDGMSTPQVQAASQALAAAGRAPLVFADFPVCGFAHTNDVHGDVTDSAAAATAISCGVKTSNGCLGLSPNGTRLTSVAETLRDEGRKIGVLTTVSLDHATPAGFFAHVVSRRDYAAIADDLFASGFDYFAGGGFHSTPNAETHASDNGYAFVRRVEQAQAAPDGKLILSSDLIFGDYGVLPSIDGGERTHFLRDATSIAIERLDNPNGFFMMVEGGRIDYFCHYNDAASFVSELLDFDEAVAAALDFYHTHPYETLILITGDHETGKVSFTDGDRAALLRQTISCDECDDTLVSACVSARTPVESALGLFASAFGLNDLTEEETAYLKRAYAVTLSGGDGSEFGSVYEPITSACAKLVAARAGLIFGSGSHSDLDVPVYALGVGQEIFAGTYENTYLHDAILLAAAQYPVA
jgi:alkaline phosphatase